MFPLLNLPSRLTTVRNTLGGCVLWFDPWGVTITKYNFGFCTTTFTLRTLTVSSTSRSFTVRLNFGFFTVGFTLRVVFSVGTFDRVLHGTFGTSWGTELGTALVGVGVRVKTCHCVCLCVYLSICLSVCLPAFLSVCVSAV